MAFDVIRAIEQIQDIAVAVSYSNYSSEYSKAKRQYGKSYGSTATRIYNACIFCPLDIRDDSTYSNRHVIDT